MENGPPHPHLTRGPIDPPSPREDHERRAKWCVKAINEINEMMAWHQEQVTMHQGAVEDLRDSRTRWEQTLRDYRGLIAASEEAD